MMMVAALGAALVGAPAHAKEKGMQELKLCAMVAELAGKVAIARDQGISQKRIDKEVDDKDTSNNKSIRQLMHATVAAVYRNREASATALKDELGFQCMMNI